MIYSPFIVLGKGGWGGTVRFTVDNSKLVTNVRLDFLSATS